MWILFAIREGKNREVRNVMAHLGLEVNRLIRVSYGPFQLGELAEGEVEEVSSRMLRDQLGERIAAARRRRFQACRRDEAESRERRATMPVEEAAAGARGLIADRKGRRVLVERSAARRSARADDADKPPATARKPPKRGYHRASATCRADGIRRDRLMRVVGGRLRGRQSASPASRDIRPTADRLRESLFNILMHAYGDPLGDARVLDLFAGTGALGIEAVSRGAAFTLFVDNGAEARALLRQNVEALGLGGVTKVYRRDATDLGPAHPIEPFSLVFLDPPYGKGLAEQALASLRDGGWLTPQALLVVEEATAAKFAAPDGFEELERRAYDDTEFVILRLSLPRLSSPRKRWDPVRRTPCNPLGSSCGLRWDADPPVTSPARRCYRRPNSFSMSASFSST